MIKKLTTLAALLLLSVSVIAVPSNSFATNNSNAQNAPGQVKKSVSVVIDTQTETPAPQQSEVSVEVTSEKSPEAQKSVEVTVGNKVAVSVNSHKKKSEDHKVTICHSTNSATNPYVRITVDKNAVDGVSGNSQGNPHDHYGEHQGPVATSEAVAAQLKSEKTKWGDIIPPVAPHNGYNWTAEGRAIYDNGCNYTSPSDEDGDVESATDTPSGKGALPETLPTTGINTNLLIIAALAADVALIAYIGQAIRNRLTAGL